jgi:hypothetical protein
MLKLHQSLRNINKIKNKHNSPSFTRSHNPLTIIKQAQRRRQERKDKSHSLRKKSKARIQQPGSSAQEHKLVLSIGQRKEKQRQGESI